MSENQYYEFLAVDRPLDERQQAEVRALSTRARITATSLPLAPILPAGPAWVNPCRTARCHQPTRTRSAVLDGVAFKLGQTRDRADKGDLCAATHMADTANRRPILHAKRASRIGEIRELRRDGPPV
jgi:hypothetical protein